MYTQLIKERDAFAGTPIHPTSATSTQTTGCVDMSKYNRVIFIISVGTLGSSGTVNAKLQTGNASDGSDAADFTGGAITQIDTAGSKIATIEISAAEMGTKRYARVSMTTAVASSIVGVYPIATEGRFPPITSGSVAAVVQQLVA